VVEGHAQSDNRSAALIELGAVLRESRLSHRSWGDLRGTLASVRVRFQTLFRLVDAYATAQASRARHIVVEAESGVHPMNPFISAFARAFPSPCDAVVTERKSKASTEVTALRTRAENQRAKLQQLETELESRKSAQSQWVGDNLSCSLSEVLKWNAPPQDRAKYIASGHCDRVQEAIANVTKCREETVALPVVGLPRGQGMQQHYAMASVLSTQTSDHSLRALRALFAAMHRCDVDANNWTWSGPGQSGTGGVRVTIVSSVEGFTLSNAMAKAGRKLLIDIPGKDTANDSDDDYMCWDSDTALRWSHGSSGICTLHRHLAGSVRAETTPWWSAPSFSETCESERFNVPTAQRGERPSIFRTEAVFELVAKITHGGSRVEAANLAEALMSPDFPFERLGDTTRNADAAALTRVVLFAASRPAKLGAAADECARDFTEELFEPLSRSLLARLGRGRIDTAPASAIVTAALVSMEPRNHETHQRVPFALGVNLAAVASDIAHDIAELRFTSTDSAAQAVAAELRRQLQLVSVCGIACFRCPSPDKFSARSKLSPEEAEARLRLAVLRHAVTRLVSRPDPRVAALRFLETDAKRRSITVLVDAVKRDSAVLDVALSTACEFMQRAVPASTRGGSVWSVEGAIAALRCRESHAVLASIDLFTGEVTLGAAATKLPPEFANADAVVRLFGPEDIRATYLTWVAISGRTYRTDCNLLGKLPAAIADSVEQLFFEVTSDDDDAIVVTLCLRPRAAAKTPDVSLQLVGLATDTSVFPKLPVDLCEGKCVWWDGADEDPTFLVMPTALHDWRERGPIHAVLCNRRSGEQQGLSGFLVAPEARGRTRFDQALSDGRSAAPIHVDAITGALTASPDSESSDQLRHPRRVVSCGHEGACTDDEPSFFQRTVGTLEPSCEHWVVTAVPKADRSLALHVALPRYRFSFTRDNETGLLQSDSECGVVIVPASHKDTAPLIPATLPGLQRYLALAPIGAVDPETHRVRPGRETDVIVLVPDSQAVHGQVGMVICGVALSSVGGAVEHAVESPSRMVKTVRFGFHPVLRTPQPAALGDTSAALSLAAVLLAGGTGTPLPEWGTTAAAAAVALLRSVRRNRPLTVMEARRLKDVYDTARLYPIVRVVCHFIAAMADPHFVRHKKRPIPDAQRLRAIDEDDEHTEPWVSHSELCKVLHADARANVGDGGSGVVLTAEEQWWLRGAFSRAGTVARGASSLTDAAEFSRWLRSAPPQLLDDAAELHEMNTNFSSAVVDCFRALQGEIGAWQPVEANGTGIAKHLEIAASAAPPEHAQFAQQIVDSVRASESAAESLPTWSITVSPEAAEKRIRAVMDAATGAADRAFAALKSCGSGASLRDEWAQQRVRWARHAAAWLRSVTPTDAVAMLLDPALASRLFPPGLFGTLVHTTAVHHAASFVECHVIARSCARMLQIIEANNSPGQLSASAVREILRELTSQRERIREKHPEVLAFEFANDLRVRKEQTELADAMVDASASKDKDGCPVAQLNMGEGKTQVVIPLLVLRALLGATSSAAIPVVHVPSPMLDETRRRLAATLSTLPGLHAAVIELPFDRAIAGGDGMIADFRSSTTQLLAGHRRVVVLVSREQVLSRTLHPEARTLEETDDADEGDRRVAARKVASFEGVLGVPRNGVHRIQHIFDEADHAFAVHEQLVYAMGQAHMPPFAEERGLAHAVLLDLVWRGRDVLRDFETRIEIDDADERAPREAIRAEHRPPRGFRVAGMTQAARELIARMFYDFVKESPASGKLRSVLHAAPSRSDFVSWTTDPEDVPPPDSAAAHDRVVLLVRGALAFGVLEHCLSKRNRVDYGLIRPLAEPMEAIDVPKKVAVPYECADVPKARSEFEHVDCAWLFTLLAYWQDGLHLSEVKAALKRLQECPELGTQRRKYRQWLDDVDPDAPERRRVPEDIAAVDPSSAMQIVHITAALRHAPSLIRYYVTDVVMAHEGYVFPESLAATAADLAALPGACGFSGTIDNASTWPRGVSPLADPPKALRATDAVTLRNLEKDASVELHDPVADPVLWAIERGFNALIDLGGHLVGVDRPERACTRWLDALRRREELHAGAASPFRGITYFDDRIGTWMVASGAPGHVAAEHKTAARVDVRDTFVVFDQAHTRGADHRLRPDAHAVMTLGPSTCKDALLQAAVRMRGIGFGQKVTVRIDRGSDAEDGIMRLAVAEASEGDESPGVTLPRLIMWALQNSAAAAYRGAALLAVQTLQHEAREHRRAEGKKAYVSNVDCDPKVMYEGAIATTALDAHARSVGASAHRARASSRDGDGPASGPARVAGPRRRAGQRHRSRRSAHASKLQRDVRRSRRSLRRSVPSGP